MDIRAMPNIFGDGLVTAGIRAADSLDPIMVTEVGLKCQRLLNRLRVSDALAQSVPMHASTTVARESGIPPTQTRPSFGTRQEDNDESLRLSALGGTYTSRHKPIT